MQANEKFNVDVALNENNENGIPQLECITPLRLLLESERNPERWEKEVKEMEAHNKERSGKKQWRSDHVNVVDYLRKQLKLDRYAIDQSFIRIIIHDDKEFFTELNIIDTDSRRNTYR